MPRAARRALRWALAVESTLSVIIHLRPLTPPVSFPQWAIQLKISKEGPCGCSQVLNGSCSTQKTSVRSCTYGTGRKLQQRVLIAWI